MKCYLFLLASTFSLFTYGLIIRWIILRKDFSELCLFVLINCSIYFCYLKLLDALKWWILKIELAGQLRDICAMKWIWDSGVLKTTLKTKKWEKRIRYWCSSMLNKNISLRKIHIDISAIISKYSINEDFFSFLLLLSSFMLCPKLHALRD